MEIRVLRYFLMVAREENITKAAELLHITQPTLSRQLMQLEDELGTKLFRRSNHSIRLTEDGMLLKRRAQELVQLADKTEMEFRRGEEELSGNIAIGSGESNSVRELADIIGRFQEKYPLVQYDLYTANADDIKDRLDKGLLDVGLLTEPVDISKYNFIRLKRKERWGVLVRADSELAEKDSIRPQDLLDIPVFLAQRPLDTGKGGPGLPGPFPEVLCKPGQGQTMAAIVYVFLGVLVSGAGFQRLFKVPQGGAFLVQVIIGAGDPVIPAVIARKMLLMGRQKFQRLFIRLPFSCIGNSDICLGQLAVQFRGALPGGDGLQSVDHLLNFILVKPLPALLQQIHIRTSVF